VNRLPLVAAGIGLALAVAALAFALSRPGTPTGPGVLVLTSTPPGAALSIDGDRRSERTPATLEHLPLGRLAVTITADGYVPFRQEVELTEAAVRAQVDAVLRRPDASSYGVARVESTPAGAHILFDGRQTELVTPATVPEIEPGVQHTLVVSLDGWVAQTVPVLVEAGAVQEVRLTLERTPLGPNEHLLTVTTSPPEARVQLDTTWYSTGSPYELRVEARRYRLRVARDGFRTSEREVQLRGGQTSTLSVELERERHVEHRDETPAPGPSGPGTVTIDARPWCNVTLDGRSLGQTPIVNRSVPSGRHTVVCTNPELGRSRTVTIEVRPGQPTRTRIPLD